MNLKRLVRASIVIGAVFSLTACGFIQKEISSEDMMLDKAEFATGISAKNLQIVEGSVQGSVDAVQYKLTFSPS